MNRCFVAKCISLVLLVACVQLHGTGADAVSKELVVQRVYKHANETFESVIGNIGDGKILQEASNKGKNGIFIEEMVGIVRDDPKASFTEAEAATIVADSDAFVVSFCDALLKADGALRERMQSIRKKAAAGRAVHGPSQEVVKSALTAMGEDQEVIRAELDAAIARSTVALDPKFIPDYVVKKAEDLAYTGTDFTAEANLDFYTRQYLSDCVRTAYLESMDNMRFFVGNYFCAGTGISKVDLVRPRKSRDEIKAFIAANLPKKSLAKGNAAKAVEIDLSPSPRAIIKGVFDSAYEYCWSEEEKK